MSSDIPSEAPLAGASAAAGAPPASSPIPTPVPAAAPLPIPATVADHSPAVSSPLNPDQTPKKSQAPEESGIMAREKRTKKESLKKRESKAASTPGGLVETARTTPDPRQLKKKLQNVSAAEKAPARYILPLPKSTDFEPAHGPLLVSHHETTGPDGETIEFFETQEQSVMQIHVQAPSWNTHMLAVFTTRNNTTTPTALQTRNFHLPSTTAKQNLSPSARI